MTKHGTILLIEGDAEQTLLVKKAFLDVEAGYSVQSVNNTGDAVKYLGGDAIYANRASFPVPFLVLLDLRLPGEGGFAVLRWLYERPGLRKRFPVVVWSSADPEQDIQLAYELGAQSFLIRPSEYKALTVTVRGIKDYWIGLNVLPGDIL